MVIRLFLFLISTISINIFAQVNFPYELSYGSIIDQGKYYSHEVIVDHTDNSLYSFTVPYGDLKFFNAHIYNLQLKRKNSIDIKIDKRVTKNISIQLMGDKLYYFYSYGKKTEVRFGVEERDPQTLRLINSEQLLHADKFINVDQKNYYDYSFSENKKFLLLLVFPRIKDKDPWSCKFLLFDENMNLLRKEVINPGPSKKEFTGRRIVVDDYGRVFFFGMTQKHRSDIEIKKHGINNRHNLWVWTAGEKEPSLIDLGFNDLFISDHIIDVKDPNEILVGGYYSTKSSSYASGTFLTKVNPSKEIVLQQTFYPFNDDNRSVFALKHEVREFNKAKRKGQTLEFPGMNLKYIERLNNGVIALIGNRSVRHQIYIPVLGEINAYFYLNYYITSFNQDGSLVYDTIVPCVQRMDESEHRQHILGEVNLTYKGKINLLFNGHPEDQKLEYHTRESALPKESNYQESQAFLIQVNEKGEYIRSPFKLFSKEEHGFKLNPYSCYKVHDRVFILNGSTAKKSRDRQSQYAKLLLPP